MMLDKIQLRAIAGDRLLDLFKDMVADFDVRAPIISGHYAALGMYPTEALEYVTRIAQESRYSSAAIARNSINAYVTALDEERFNQQYITHKSQHLEAAE